MILDSHGSQWIEGLRRVPYLEAREALRTLPGVGAKVQLAKKLLAFVYVAIHLRLRLYIL